MRYKALALQTTCYAVNRFSHRAEVDNSMMRTIERIGKQVRASKAFIGTDLRLVVLPEYCLTGFPMGETPDEWRQKAAIEPNGREYDAFAALAETNNVYVSGNVYETDPHFPALYFQTSFVISPEGNLLLRYRRLLSMFAPTPYDVWERYLDIYGLEAVFPVARTDIGNVACIASEEVLYPEIARCHAMRGAEVFLHSSSEIGSPMLTQKNIAKRARALENLAFVVSANSAGIADTDIPSSSTDGSSQIVDFRGMPLAEASAGESMVANATIDIAALRHERNRVGMPNILARQRFELFAESYSKHSFYPPNTLLHGKEIRSPIERTHFIATQRQTIEYLRASGVIEVEETTS